MKSTLFIILFWMMNAINAQSTNNSCINSFISDQHYSKLLYDSLLNEKVIDSSIYKMTVEKPFQVVSFAGSNKEGSLYKLCDIVVYTKLGKPIRIELKERTTVVPSSKLELMLSGEVLLYQNIEFRNQRLKPLRNGKLTFGDEIVITEIIDYASSYKFDWWIQVKLTWKNKTYIGWIPETSEAICNDPNTKCK